MRDNMTPELKAFVEEHGDKEIEVCSDCEMACCWQGVLMCDTAYEAGTKMITVEEAAELALEHFDYWKADLDQQRENAPEPKVHHKRAFKAKKAEAGKGEIVCSFCGKTREEVKKLVRAERETICNECVSLCVELMGEEEAEPYMNGMDEFVDKAVQIGPATTEEKIQNLARALAGGQARKKNLEARVVKLEELHELDELTRLKKAGELREALAKLEFERWAGWMKYMFKNMTEENLAMWKRQMDTPYEELTDREKNLDREEVGRTIKLLKRYKVDFTIL